jgi:glycosyltransferase involved in cell wall biosynthesis
MKILFLDQTGKVGGAELALADVAEPYRETCLVGLFEAGPFQQVLEQRQIPVHVLADRAISVKKDSSLWQGLGSLGQLWPLIQRVAVLSKDYDIIYANTQKALVVGALASILARKRLVYHLHDILSKEHFSATNRRLAVTLANRCASLVIADSQATKAAFVAAGGREDITPVVYYGFDPAHYQVSAEVSQALRQKLGITDRFVIGHFSRLSPWKGQLVLIEALAHCPPQCMAMFVGDALFGEQTYVDLLHQRVAELGLTDRVQFLGFRSEVPQLMAACDLVAHTSTAPEPFGRVIVEGMLCQRPVVAAGAGGATEIVEHGETGWQSPPGDALKLAEVINHCYQQPDRAAMIAGAACRSASQRFSLEQMHQQIHQLIQPIYPSG